ncbi:hypothetical protein QRQ56_29225 [Bradyrhizobium sp. U531]|uniref:hypothetical protein n=1 Tax=Bradyrhizobium sp. U531 TaxID=3053458 RepID=UPI003F436426
MLFVFQIPISDFRFFARNEKRSRRPDWLVPQADNEFLRCFGMLRERPLGGINGWVGEGVICRARNALTFPEGISGTVFGKQKTRVWQVQKQFFHDGKFTGKLEVRLKLGRAAGSSFEQPFHVLVDEILSRPVRIPHFDAQGQLYLPTCGIHLAEKFRRSTVEGKLYEEDSPFIAAGRSAIFIQNQRGNVRNVPPFAKEFSLPLDYESTARGFVRNRGPRVRLFYWRQRSWERDVPVFLCLHPAALADFARQLRIYMLRLWTELECLASCLRLCTWGNVRPEPRGPQSQLLQQYLDTTLKRIKRLENQAAKIIGTDAYEIGLSAFETFRPSDINRLLSAMEDLDFRYNISRVIGAYAGLAKGINAATIERTAVTTNINGNQIIISPGPATIGEVNFMTVGDNYNVNQSPGAAVGRGNDVRIESASIVVGSSNTVKANQSASIEALIEALKASGLPERDKSTAVRHLENVKEQVEAEHPDKGVIANSLDRLKSVFTMASVGAELYEKGKSLFDSFGVQI